MRERTIRVTVAGSVKVKKGRVDRKRSQILDEISGGLRGERINTYQ
jgi:hypothetical protein